MTTPAETTAKLAAIARRVSPSASLDDATSWLLQRIAEQPDAPELRDALVLAGAVAVVRGARGPSAVNSL